MKDEKTINSWDELIKFIENMNYFQKTIILNGWFREIVNGKSYIKKLTFKVVPVEVLKELNQNDDGSKQKK